jgi:hypothetical protein
VFDGGSTVPLGLAAEPDDVRGLIRDRLLPTNNVEAGEAKKDLKRDIVV